MESEPKKTKTFAEHMSFIFPAEIIKEILSYVPFEGTAWLNCRLVCKKFLEICKRVQDPSTQDNRAIRWCCGKKKFDLVLKLLEDPRVRADYKEIMEIVAGSGQTDLLRVLLARKEVQAKWRPGSKLVTILLWIAIDNGFPETAMEIMKDPKTKLVLHSEHLLLTVARKNIWQLVEPFINHPRMDESDDFSYTNLLREATSYDDNWMTVREIIKHAPVDPSIEEFNVIEFAAYKGHFESVREMMEHPKSKFPWLSIPFFKEEYADLLKSIVESGRLDYIEDGTEEFRNMLFLGEAIKSKSISIVKYFMSKIPRDYLKKTITDLEDKLADSTGEIIQEVLDYVGIFEEMAHKIAHRACVFGNFWAVQMLMWDSRFKATQERMNYLKEIIALANE